VSTLRGEAFTESWRLACENRFPTAITAHAMPDLAALYQRYIACLNQQAWDGLGEFVHDDVSYNGEPIGLSGYRRNLENDCVQIPDLRFKIALLVVDERTIAARLRFDVTPAGDFLGVPVNGRRVSFTENVFYEVEDGKMRHVWSIIDKAAIEAQVGMAWATGSGADFFQR
jgi:predicted ester cyclase